MKPIFILVMLLCVVGCGNRTTHNDSPPGFSIVCNGQGLYGVNWGGYIIEDAYGIQMKTRQQAIDRAWDQYDYKNSESDKRDAKVMSKIQWHDCNN